MARAILSTTDGEDSVSDVLLIENFEIFEIGLAFVRGPLMVSAVKVVTFLVFLIMEGNGYEVSGDSQPD